MCDTKKPVLEIGNSKLARALGVTRGDVNYGEVRYPVWSRDELNRVVGRLAADHDVCLMRFGVPFLGAHEAAFTPEEDIIGRVLSRAATFEVKRQVEYRESVVNLGEGNLSVGSSTIPGSDITSFADALRVVGELVEVSLITEEQGIVLLSEIIEARANAVDLRETHDRKVAAARAAG